MKEKKICLITFSNNADHQNTVYSMFNALYPEHEVYTIGIINPKTNIAPTLNEITGLAYLYASVITPD